MHEATDRFVSSVPVDGIAIVFIAGHGASADSKSFILPVDFAPSTILNGAFLLWYWHCVFVAGQACQHFRFCKPDGSSISAMCDN